MAADRRMLVSQNQSHTYYCFGKCSVLAWLSATAGVAKSVTSHSRGIHGRRRDPARSRPPEGARARHLPDREAARQGLHHADGRRVGPGARWPPSPPAPSTSTPPSASAAFPAAGSPRSTAPSRAARPRSRLHLAANVQKAGGVAAYIDAEHALDIEYAKKLGVDVENLLVSQPDTGEQALEIVRDPGALRRGGHRRHRLGRGAGAQGRDRGRDGRQPRRACRPGS